jgi:hypothetical protein
MDRMKSASGADFDKAFAVHVLEDHKRDIADTKALPTATIPVLEKHRDTAQMPVDTLGPSASADGAKAAPNAVK